MEAVTFKTLEFPSTNFPSADLRVQNDTQYDCTCPSCSSPLLVHFGWLLQPGFSSPTVSHEQAKAVRSYFQEISVNVEGHFNLVKCADCKEDYMVRWQTTETSNGTYCVVI